MGISSLSTWIIVGVVGVIVVRRFAPRVASLLGMLVMGAIAVWGYGVYEQGGVVGILRYPLTRPMFFGGVAALFLYECVQLGIAIKAAERRRAGSQGDVDF
ncbi:MAG: hypothetical protein R3C68_14195 [Myxococcota bacterium]